MNRYKLYFKLHNEEMIFEVDAYSAAQAKQFLAIEMEKNNAGHGYAIAQSMYKGTIYNKATKEWTIVPLANFKFKQKQHQAKVAAQARKIYMEQLEIKGLERQKEEEQQRRYDPTYLFDEED